MQVPFSKTTGEQILPGHEVLDQLGRKWLFSFGAKPTIRTNDPQGELHVYKPGGKAQSAKGFLTSFFPDVEFREPVRVEPKATKVEIKKPRKLEVKKAQRKVVTDSEGRFRFEKVEE